MADGKKELDSFLEDLSIGYREELLERVKITNPKNRSEMDGLLRSFRKEKKFNKIGKFTKMYWTQRGWSSEDAEIKKSENKVNNIPNGSPMQESYWLNSINPKTGRKYSIEEAKYKIKSQRKFNLEYWIERGQTKEEARRSVEEFQKRNSKKMVDKMKDDPGKYQDRTWSQYRYWMRKEGLSENDAKKRVSFMQDKLSIDFLLSKYGEIEAIKKYEEISGILSESQKIESYIKKYGKDLGSFKYQEKIRKSTTGLPMTSLESLKFFIPIYKKVREHVDRDDIFWGIGGSKEYFLWDSENSKIFFYDFTILSKKIIIEYHGKRWHPNPNWDREKWEKWNLFGMNADEKRSLDLYKKLVAEREGFTVIEVFSDEKEKIDTDWIYKGLNPKL